MDTFDPEKTPKRTPIHVPPPGRGATSPRGRNSFRLVDDDSGEEMDFQTPIHETRFNNNNSTWKAPELLFFATPESINPTPYDPNSTQNQTQRPPPRPQQVNFGVKRKLTREEEENNNNIELDINHQIAVFERYMSRHQDNIKNTHTRNHITLLGWELVRIGLQQTKGPKASTVLEAIEGMHRALGLATPTASNDTANTGRGSHKPTPHHNTPPSEAQRTWADAVRTTQPTQSSPSQAGTATPTARPQPRNDPKRVVVLWPKEGKIAFDNLEAAGRIIDKLNAHLATTETPRVVTGHWTEANNFIITAKSPENAKALVGNFQQWKNALPPGAAEARLDRKIHQVVIQAALVRDATNNLLTPNDIVNELTETADIKPTEHMMPPRVLAKLERLNEVVRAPILLSLSNENTANRIRKGIVFRYESKEIRNYTETARIARCRRCHELSHTTQKCANRARCELCGSTEHAKANHPPCDQCTDNPEGCTHSNLNCVNCGNKHASTDPACPIWIKKRGMMKEPTANAIPGGRPPKTWNAKPTQEGKTPKSTNTRGKQKDKENQGQAEKNKEAASTTTQARPTRKTRKVGGNTTNNATTATTTPQML
ncbi:hypothetical protein FRC19_001091 [Serendipita sp. 401]|nr:hypothetical protein FRC19_001091 [Serendipita sp. 401]